MGAEESDFEGWAFPFPGVTLIEDFVTPAEEAEMVRLMDRDPWKLSQSGRRKQVGWAREGSHTTGPCQAPDPRAPLLTSLSGPSFAATFHHSPEPLGDKPADWGEGGWGQGC